MERVTVLRNRFPAICRLYQLCCEHEEGATDERLAFRGFSRVPQDLRPYIEVGVAEWVCPAAFLAEGVG